MEESEFLTDVQRHANLEHVESARAVTHATLTALGEVLPRTEAENAASQLPETLAGWMAGAADGEGASYTPEEFVERVREEETDDGRVDERDAHRHTKAALNTFAAAVTPGELADIRQRLPDGYDELFDPPDTADALGGS